MSRLITAACLLSHVPGATSQESSSSPFKCDRIQSGTCYVDLERAVSGGVVVTPSLLELREGDGEVENFRISEGSKLRCYGDLCKITIRGFAKVFVAGTMEGADILVEATKRVKVPAGGSIIGNGMGYAKTKGPGAGSAACGYKNSRYLGASYGGMGGSECPNSDSTISRAVYGSESAPSDFGSGGACGNDPQNGGGRLHMIAPTIVIDGTAQENGGDATGGALGSGGSVLMVADQIVGSGTIEARGGSCGSAQYNCAAGGGGRVSLHADIISKETLSVDVEGGSMLQCDKAKGQPGTYLPLCKTSTCYNGGSPLSGEECGCECVEPWGGGDCTVCNRVCLNGGVIEPDSCSCTCPFGWTGPTCTVCNGADICSDHGVCNTQKECSCDSNFYGDNCSVFCESSETCSTNGFCSSGGTCVCKEGKVGPSCMCDVIDCAATAVSRTLLCSGKGTCSNGECKCEPGFYGCSCEAFCARSTTCSSHGTCSENGKCKCDPGYIGEGCGELDIENYCRVSENGEVFTMSGHPCLLGLEDVLGHGMDIVRGAKQSRVLQLRYTKGRVFKHNLLGTFEIPDNVDCEEITVDKLVSSTRTYTGTLEYRRELASEVGMMGFFKSSYFSASAEFQMIKEFRFQQQQFLSEKKQYHRLYSCSIRTSQPFLTTRAKEIVAEQTGEQRVRSLGTHVIERAEFGGFIKVRAYLDSCVLASLDEARVSTEVGVAFTEVAISGEHTSACDLINTHSQFEKEVGGGEKSKLVITNMMDNNYLSAWIDSLSASPTVTRRFLYELGVLVPAVREDIHEYEASNEVTDEITVDEHPDVCPEVSKGQSACAAAVVQKANPASAAANPQSILIVFEITLTLLAVAVFH